MLAEGRIMRPNPALAGQLLSHMSDEVLQMGLENPKDLSLLTPIEEILHFHLGYEFAEDAADAAYPLFAALKRSDYSSEAARRSEAQKGQEFSDEDLYDGY